MQETSVTSCARLCSCGCLTSHPPLRAFVDRVLVDRVLEVREVALLVDELRDLVDFETLDREVLFFLIAPLLDLVDFAAVDRDVLFLAVPVRDFVDLLLPALDFVLLLPALDFVDLDAPPFAFVLDAPLFAFVDFAVPLLAFVDLVELRVLLRDVDALPFDVVLAAISLGSSGYSDGYRSANSCFTLAPEKAKQPAMDSIQMPVGADTKVY